MKKGINYWSFAGGLEGKKGLSAAMKEAKQAGFEGIELAVGFSGELSLKTTKSQCSRIRRQAEQAQIDIPSVASGVYWTCNLGSPGARDRNKAVSALKKMSRIASWLGAEALLVIPAAVDIFFDPSAPVVPYDEAYRHAQAGLKKVLPTAEQCGVTLAVENVWNRFLYSPLEMARFIDSFGSERVGCYFDTGNVMAYGYPEQWIRILGKRLASIHLKDFKRSVGTADGFCDLLEGDVNWPDVTRALDKAGYDGYLIAEMIPTYQYYPEVRILNTSNAMDAIMGRK